MSGFNLAEKQEQIYRLQKEVDADAKRLLLESLKKEVTDYMKKDEFDEQVNNVIEEINRNRRMADGSFIISLVKWKQIPDDVLAQVAKRLKVCNIIQDVGYPINMGYTTVYIGTPITERIHDLETEVELLKERLK
jgi:hypothetical protein